MAFANSFFSFSGQKERLSNVAAVLNIAVNPFSKDKVVANVSSPTAKAALEFGANNPYTTAGIVSLGAASVTRTAISSGIAGLSTGTKVAAGAVGIAAVPALATSERLRVAAIKTVGTVTPERLAKLGSDTGKVVETPSPENLLGFVKENKGPLAFLGVAALVTGGARTAGIASTALNTIATNRNTNATLNPADVKIVLPSAPSTSPQKEIASAGLSSNAIPTTKSADVVADPPRSLPPKAKAQATRPKRRKAYKQKCPRVGYGHLTLRFKSPC